MLKTPARRADVHSMCLAYSTPPPVQCAQTQQAPSPSRAEECATNFASQLSSHPPLLPKHSILTGTQLSLGLSPPRIPPVRRMQLCDTMGSHAHSLSVCKHIHMHSLSLSLSHTHTHTHTHTHIHTHTQTHAHTYIHRLGYECILF
jgi:hypothetical protein